MSAPLRTSSERRSVRHGSSYSMPNDTSLLLLVSVALAGFFAGNLYTLHLGIDSCNTKDKTNEMFKSIPQAEQRVIELQRQLKICQMQGLLQTQKQTTSFPDTMTKYIAGMARTSKTDFMSTIDLGVPVDLPQPGMEYDVLVLYQRPQALPDNFQVKNLNLNTAKAKTDENKDSSNSWIPQYETKEALKHCDYLNIVLTDHTGGRNQCLAIVPQYESYHIQKWMRLQEKGGIAKPTKNDKNKASAQQQQQQQVELAPLRPVSRGMQSNGYDQFSPPRPKDMKQNWGLLGKYFSSFDDALKELKPLVEKVATPKKTVTVMVSNFGQSELLVNFVCAAKARNLDISSILVFATDPDTKILAESLGLTAFYDERNFGSMPEEAAGQYGDRKFTAMMMAKVICVQMVSALKYNILFQDVDIVWYKDPLKFFETQYTDFDMLFQDDGGHTVRYAPYSANSGFYYVRHNARTEYFFNALLLAGDLILKTDSHQQALIALLSEHVSLYGLRVKVFSRDGEEFPGGYQYHQKSGKYMRAFFAGEIHPYIFHMSWTFNKDNKLLFLKQMGEWFVQEQCVHKKVDDIPGLDVSLPNAFVSTCCSVEPLISCHYRDKPSKIPCKDSPPIDEGKKSWW